MKMRRYIIYVSLLASMLDSTGGLSSLDDSGLFDGCPVGLQLIGRTQEEEAVIAMTEIVDRALREYEKGQGSS